MGGHPARPASMTPDSFAERLERSIEINLVLLGPFRRIEVARLAASPAQKPKALPEFDVVAERAELPAFRVVILVAHDRCDPRVGSSNGFVSPAQASSGIDL